MYVAVSVSVFVYDYGLLRPLLVFIVCLLTRILSGYLYVSAYASGYVCVCVPVDVYVYVWGLL